MIILHGSPASISSVEVDLPALGHLAEWTHVASAGVDAIHYEVKGQGFQVSPSIVLPGEYGHPPTAHYIGDGCCKTATRDADLHYMRGSGCSAPLPARRGLK